MRPRLQQEQSIVYYDIWRNIPGDAYRTNEICSIVEQDIVQSNLTVADAIQKIWIFDCGPEGISSDDLALLLQWFLDQGMPIENFRVIFSCVENVDLLPYPAICLPDRLIYQQGWYNNLQKQKVNWKELSIDKGLICLMRRASIGRAHLARRLLKQFSDQEMLITLGSDQNIYSAEVANIIQPQRFPIAVDDLQSDPTAQHCVPHDYFYHCAVNLVVESSGQLDPETWQSQFITEKTFKAFAWYQFPLWYAVPGLVAQVRSLGFDVFDDLFDNHQYDNITDPWQRMNTIVTLARTICNNNLVEIRVKYWNRLQKNADLIDRIHVQARSKHLLQINQLKNYA